MADTSQATGIDICLGQKSSDEGDDEDDDSEGSSHGVQEYVKKRWNVNFPFQDDRSADHLRPETFDVIHSRMLAEGINASRWPAYVRDLRRLLNRGGWVQMCEILPHIQSSNGRLSDNSCLTRWWTTYARCLTHMGKNVRVGRELDRLLRDEGFEQVTSRSYDLPIGEWRQGIRFLPVLLASWLKLVQKCDRWAERICALLNTC